MLSRGNMRSMKHFASVKRLVFLTGLLSLTTIALAANLLTKRRPGTDVSPSSEIDRHLSIRSEIMNSVKEKHNRNQAIHYTVSQNPIWSYHAAENGLYERANVLVQSNLLTLEGGQTSHGREGDGNGLSYFKTGLNSEVDTLNHNRRESDQPAQLQEQGSHLGHRENVHLPARREDDTPKMPAQHKFKNLQQPLSEGGRWRSWPECLCGAQKGVDCIRFLEPAESRQMAHGSGGACSWRAWRDSGEKVISVSLFGPRATEDPHLHTLVNESREHYPGWSVWVYVRHPNPSELCPLLQTSPHVFFCDTRMIPSLGDLKRTSPLVWRVSPLGDPKVKKMFVRNLNSSPVEREAAAVREWVQSNKTWHVMRDHPSQTDPVPGGQWGVRWEGDIETNMAALRHILLTRVVPSFTAEQVNKFLSGVLWSKMLREGLMLHDAFNCQSAPDDSFRPWPTRRFGDTYVGMSEPEGRVPDCPVECRPSNHRDWFTC